MFNRKPEFERTGEENLESSLLWVLGIAAVIVIAMASAAVWGVHWLIVHARH